MTLLRHRGAVWPVAIGMIGLVLCIAVSPAWSATSGAAVGHPLRVVTAAVAPFVLPKIDPPGGFSIDLWNEVARRMHVEFGWTVVSTQPELLQAVRRGDADIAIAAITMTPEREKVVDFSHSYFDSGLQIMVRARNETALLATFQSIPWVAVGQLFGVAIILIFLLANVLWLVERRNNPTFRKGYLQAIGESLWRATCVVSTLGGGDTLGATARIAVVAMWLIGVVLIAQLTATVTSTQTLQRLESSIRGPDDLPGKTIASVPGSIAGDYLTQRGLPFVSVNYGPDAIRLLTQGDVQAVVFDAPTLQYWAAKQGSGVVQVVGPIFRPEKYAIAVAEGSALRKPINEALLEIYEDGSYEKIHAKWFSQDK